MTSSWRTSAYRALMQHNPLLPFRGRLNWLSGATLIPDGLVVETKYGMCIRIHDDEMYRSLYLTGVYEPFHTKIYSRIVRPEATVLDVGTNFGWYAALFSGWVGPNGSVHAFEPVPFIYEYAEETLRLNRCACNVRLNRCALGARKEGIRIYTFDNLPHGHACTTDLGRDDALPHDCEAVTLDEYVQAAGVQHCLFMKIDVEGHELEVFRGGASFLKRDWAPIIGFEVNLECLGHRRLRPGDLMDCLRSYGYTDFFSFSARGGIQKATELGSASDYLALKPERRPDVAAALKTGRLLL